MDDERCITNSSVRHMWQESSGWYEVTRRYWARSADGQRRGRRRRRQGPGRDTDALTLLGIKPQNHRIKTFSLPPPLPTPPQDSPSIFLPSLFNLPSDMFHGESTLAVKAAGWNGSQRGLAGYFEGMHDGSLRWSCLPLSFYSTLLWTMRQRRVAGISGNKHILKNTLVSCL